MIDLGELAGDGGAVTLAGGPLPSTLPVLPLRETVPFPDTVIPLAIGQERSMELVNDVLAGSRMLVMVTSRVADVEAPGPEQLYDVGVVGIVTRMLKMPDGTLRILVQGAQRVHVDRWVRSEPYLVAQITERPDAVQASAELTALVRNVEHTFGEIVEAVPYLPEELRLAVANLDDPSALANLIGASLRISTEERQSLLEEADVGRRLRRVAELLAHELEVVNVGAKIQEQVAETLTQGQREMVLRQQLRAIQQELGEGEEGAAEVEELRERLDALELPEEVRRQTDRELSRLASLPAAAAEFGVIRTYLEWIADLPWDTTTVDNLDLKNARKVLDADHYGLEQVKDRILEFLAVKQLNPEAHGSILCFVGPPGTGKTSLGRSIAHALGREFERISVGGVRDESEVRGHRRTYVGAMPGVILRALRDAGTRNPLFMVDEIDKMGADFRGDPASAMLEVLDPEQNSTFRDHYLDLPFDLSGVMFVCTANDIDRVPGPLRDRMEIITLAGYTQDEKLEIARRYLVPRQLERNGLKPSQLAISDAAIKAVIADYTREAGVRQLERELGSICRKIARQVAEGKLRKKVSVGAAKAHELLGRRRFTAEQRRRTKEPGVATGLAWTPVGGDVLFIEATSYPGSGKLVITGQLGDVMRESAQAALSWVRGHVDEVAPNLGEGWFAEHDIHVHVPAGAIPKDGPSAGITMATALASLLSGRPVRDDVAMTGEITLTGQVLPIGGLKEKALAAQRFGIRHVLAPAQNAEDVEDIPEHLRAKLRFTFVERIEDVLAHALRARPVARPTKPKT